MSSTRNQLTSTGQLSLFYLCASTLVTSTRKRSESKKTGSYDRLVHRPSRRNLGRSSDLVNKFPTLETQVSFLHGNSFGVSHKLGLDKSPFGSETFCSGFSRVLRLWSLTVGVDLNPKSTSFTWFEEREGLKTFTEESK